MFVQYVVSEDHQGMLRAIERHFQGVVWQRCQVHFVRNLLNHTAARDKAAVLAQLKTITEALTLTAARKAIGEAVEALGRRTRGLRLCSINTGKRSWRCTGCRRRIASACAPPTCSSESTRKSNAERV